MAVIGLVGLKRASECIKMHHFEGENAKIFLGRSPSPDPTPRPHPCRRLRCLHRPTRPPLFTFLNTPLCISTQLSSLHKCNTTTIQLQHKNFFLYCSCIALVWTPATQHCNTNFLQLAENLQATCSSCKKTCIAVVLCLCRLLQYNKIFVLCYCSCIALVRTTLLKVRPVPGSELLGTVAAENFYRLDVCPVIEPTASKH